MGAGLDGMIFDDLEWPLTLISRLRHFSTLNISNLSISATFSLSNLSISAALSLSSSHSVLSCTIFFSSNSNSSSSLLRANSLSSELGSAGPCNLCFDAASLSAPLSIVDTVASSSPALTQPVRARFSYSGLLVRWKFIHAKSARPKTATQIKCENAHCYNQSTITRHSRKLQTLTKLVTKYTKFTTLINKSYRSSNVISEFQSTDHPIIQLKSQYKSQFTTQSTSAYSTAFQWLRKPYNNHG